MKLNDFASELVAKNRFVKASFGGFAGSGKTRTATELILGCYQEFGIEKPLLFIDNEKGSRFLIPLFKEKLPKVQVLVKETRQLADVLQAFEYLESGEIGFVFIDSLSKIWYKFIDQYMERFGKDSKGNWKKQSMFLQDWGRVIPDWQKKFSDRFVNIDGNIIFTGRGGNEYELKEVDEGGETKKQFVKSGVKMKMAAETPYEPDLNIWMERCEKINENGKLEVWREATIMKDRANLIDGKTFVNPKFKDFKPVIQYLLNVPVGEVKQETLNINMSPSDSRDYQNEQENKSIELETITNLFVLQKFGSTAEAKALKLKILRKFFGTSTWGEIEKQAYKQLRNSRIALEKFMDESVFEEDKEKFLENYTLSLFDAIQPPTSESASH